MNKDISFLAACPRTTQQIGEGFLKICVMYVF
jgi:hypothetical protein